MFPPDLKALENRTLYLLREIRAEARRPAVLWSMGKDSTALLHLCRKAFFGEIPFPVIHIDTTFKLPEMYAFRREVAERWNLDLHVATNRPELERGMDASRGAEACCSALKTEPLKRIIVEHRIDALLLAIRRDEHGVRGKERVFSPRDPDSRWDYLHQPLELWDSVPAIPVGGHLRVHPMLHWTEVDVWRYTAAEGIPVNPLYFSRDGRRYRSLGCGPCTVPMESAAATLPEILTELNETRTAERAGRLQDKERAFVMQKLRSMGYM
ncbi:MAG: sulfate adenylyltransferase subunit CysD [Pseudomonadota bacterium]